MMENKTFFFFFNHSINKTKKANKDENKLLNIFSFMKKSNAENKQMMQNQKMIKRNNNKKKN